MAIKKRTVVFKAGDQTDSDTAAPAGTYTKSLSIGGRYGVVRKVAVLSAGTTPDATVGVTITDAESEVLSTWASADYTTRTVKYVVAKAAVTENGSAATADSNAALVVGKGPLSIVATITAGVGHNHIVTVDVYIETTVEA